MDETVQPGVTPESPTGSGPLDAAALQAQLEARDAEIANLKTHLRDKQEKQATKGEPKDPGTDELQSLKEEVAELKRAQEAQIKVLEKPLLDWAYQHQDLGKYYSPSTDKDGQNYLRLSRTMKELEKEDPLITIDAKSRQEAMLKAHEINKIKYGWDAKAAGADTKAGTVAGFQKSSAGGAGSTAAAHDDSFGALPESDAAAYRELGLSPERVAELQQKFGHVAR